MLETESPWGIYYLLWYFSPLKQERFFPVGMKGGEQAASSGFATEQLKDGNS